MKKIVFLLLAGLATSLSYGQSTDREKDLKSVSKDTVDGWKKGGYLNINGTQTNLTNWVAGGQNSVSITGLGGLYADLKRGNMTWENSIDVGYGIMNQSNRLFSPTGEKWIKTDDRIDITSKYGRKFSKSLYYAALTNFRTQSTAGYAYPNDSIEISGFLAPAYWLTALGVDYKPNSKFSAFIAPVTTKFTFVNDRTLADSGAFGVDPALLDVNQMPIAGTGSRMRTEFGGYIRMKYKTGFGPLNDKGKQQMFFTTKLDLFSNYLENPERIDINWETLLEVELWRFLSLTLSTHLIYDDDIDIAVLNDANEQIAFGPRVQFKQVFGLGVSWKFDQTPEVE